jgi:hypothetical protein
MHATITENALELGVVALMSTIKKSMVVVVYKSGW